MDLSLVINENASVTYFTLAKYLLDLEDALRKKIDIVEEAMIYEKLRPFVNKSKVLIYDK